MRIIKLSICFIALFTVQFVSAEKNEKEKFIVAGYVNANWIKDNTDLEFVNHLDRIFFFGMSPDTAGNFIVKENYLKSYQIIRSKMTKGQKILLVVGGGATSKNMHIMGNDSIKRNTYANKLVAFAKEHKFDGIDMDWETYSKSGPRLEVPTENLIKLLSAIKEQMPKNFILTAALGGSKNSAKQAADILYLVEDVSVMLYASVTKEGLHAPMSYVIERLQNFTAVNFPNDKLLVGVPFYGRTTDKKTMVYRNIVDKLTPGDTQTGIYDGYSFNSVGLLKEKVKYLKEHGYRGIMIWETTQDAPYSNPMSLLRGICEEVNAKTK